MLMHGTYIVEQQGSLHTPERQSVFYYTPFPFSSRTSSALYLYLWKVMTAPRRPEPPVIIRCEQRSIIVKWYPGSPGGAHKYRLQARLVEGLDGIEATHDKNNNNKYLAKATEYNRASTAGAAGGGGASRGGAGGGGRKRRAAWGAAGDGSGSGGGEWVTVYEGVDHTAKVNECAMPAIRMNQ